MDTAIWTPAKLTPEQERLLKEAEGELNGGVLLALERRDVVPSQLTSSQLGSLQGVEQKLGLVIVALRPG
jgi:hypothetical protein